MIDRRVDFTALREHQAMQQYRAEGGTSAISSPRRGEGATRPTSTSDKYSLSAPPTISASRHNGVVPPPPPYPASLAGTVRAAQSHAKKLASSPQTQAAVASMKKRASELVSSGKFDEAKHLAAKALQMSPNDKAVLKNMATTSLDRAKQFVNSQDFDKALQYARESLAYDGTSVAAKQMVDGLLQKAGINPSDPAERLRSADLLASQGRNDEAFVEYQAALKLKPSPEAHIGIGNIALRAGQKDRAKNEYQAALELDSNSSPAYRQLGLLKLGSGDIVGANAALSRALVLNPKDKHAGKSLVELWQQQVSKVPSANSHLGLARAYQLSGDLQSAQAQYRTVVRIDPENPHLPAARQAFKLALSRQQAERAAEAARTLEAHGAIPDAYQKAHEAVKLSPGDAELRVHEGHLLERLQRYGPARESYLNALKIDPHNSAAAQGLKNLPAEVASLPIPSDLIVPPSQTLAAPSIATTGSLTPGVPAPTHDPVANISSFATSLRDQMLTQKAQIQQVETVAQKVISQIGKPTGTSLVTATASDAASDATAAAADDAIASAASAIAAAKGGAAPAAAAATATAPAASSTEDLLKPLGPKVGSAYKQMQSLKSQNEQLQAQIKKMHDSLRKIRGSAPQPEPEMAAAAPTAPSAAEAFEPPMAPSIATTMAQQMPSSALPGVQAIAPRIDPNTGGLPLRQPIPIAQMGAPNPVRFELEGVSPRLGNVELAVILRNDADVPLTLPPKMRAMINYSNRRPAEVKPVFSDAIVPPHGAVRGVIRVPFDKVDPTADLVIPGLLPEGYSQRDVHLITSMASR